MVLSFSCYLLVSGDVAKEHSTRRNKKMAQKKSTKKQQFWPGTNIVKSSGDAFDWRNTAKGLYTQKEINHMNGCAKANNTTKFKPSFMSFTRAAPSEV